MEVTPDNTNANANFITCESNHRKGRIPADIYRALLGKRTLHLPNGTTTLSGKGCVIGDPLSESAPESCLRQPLGHEAPRDWRWQLGCVTWAHHSPL